MHDQKKEALIRAKGYCDIETVTLKHMPVHLLGNHWPSDTGISEEGGQVLCIALHLPNFSIIELDRHNRKQYHVRPNCYPQDWYLVSLLLPNNCIFWHWSTLDVCIQVINKNLYIIIFSFVWLKKKEASRHPLLRCWTG